MLPVEAIMRLWRRNYGFPVFQPVYGVFAFWGYRPLLHEAAPLRAVSPVLVIRI